MGQREFSRKKLVEKNGRFQPLSKEHVCWYMNLFLGGIARILVLFLGKDSFLFEGGDAYG
jgi:hypothetical protein